MYFQLKTLIVFLTKKMSSWRHKKNYNFQRKKNVGVFENGNIYILIYIEVMLSLKTYTIKYSCVLLGGENKAQGLTNPTWGTGAKMQLGSPYNTVLVKIYIYLQKKYFDFWLQRAAAAAPFALAIIRP